MTSVAIGLRETVVYCKHFDQKYFFLFQVIYIKIIDFNYKIFLNDIIFILNDLNENDWNFIFNKFFANFTRDDND